MVTSTSRLSYTDCYEVLDQALASPKGLRIRFDAEGDARHFRTRLHSARQLNRNDNAVTYPADHQMHGLSEYDALVVKLRANGEGWVLLIEKVATAMQIEEIEE